MTLKSQMAADVEAVFLDTDDFAQAITYTPDGGDARSINAIVTWLEDFEDADNEGSRTLVKRCELKFSMNATTGIQLEAGTDELSEHDTFTVDGITLKPQSRTQRQDGMAIIIAVGIVDRERSSGRQFLER